MKKGLFLGLATVTLSGVGMLFSSTARAAVITYNEAVDGDLPDFASSSPIFALGLGTNTFTGAQTFSNAVSLSSDFDSLIFSIPTDTRLESIKIDISLLPGGSGIFDRAGYILQNSSFVDISTEESIAIPSANLSLFTSNLPLGSGQFALQNSLHSGSLNPGEFQTAAYTLSLNVAATTVPEPTSTLSLLALGTLGAASALKRKQNQKSTEKETTKVG